MAKLEDEIQLQKVVDKRRQETLRELQALERRRTVNFVKCDIRVAITGTIHMRLQRFFDTTDFLHKGYKAWFGLPPTLFPSIRKSVFRAPVKAFVPSDVHLHFQTLFRIDPSKMLAGAVLAALTSSWMEWRSRKDDWEGDVDRYDTQQNPEDWLDNAFATAMHGFLLTNIRQCPKPCKLLVVAMHYIDASVMTDFHMTR